MGTRKCARSGNIGLRFSNLRQCFIDKRGNFGVEALKHRSRGLYCRFRNACHDQHVHRMETRNFGGIPARRATFRAWELLLTPFRRR